MKKFLKYTGYTLGTLVALILLYLGCAWLFSHLSSSGEKPQKPDIVIYILSNGVHTDVVMPVKTDQKDWSQDFLYKNTRSNDSSMQFAAVGWGDKGFYLNTPTWADLKFSTAFNAAFGLSTAAMHATFEKSAPVEGKECVRLTIDTVQYRRLIDYIENSWQADAAGRPIVISTEARYGETDAFYEAKGSYNLFHTCNTWTNNALKACRQKACWWTPFQGGIFYIYRN